MAHTKKKYRGNGTNNHHLLPRSVGGKDFNNIVELPILWHEAWHLCFGNLTPMQAIELIDLVMRPNTKWSAHRIVMLQNKLRGGNDENDDD